MRRCAGCSWQGLGSGGRCRGGQEEGLELPCAQHKMVPAGSVTGPSCTKAEPARCVCGVSLKTYLRKGRKCQTERGVNKKSEKQQGEHQGQSSRRCSMVVEALPPKGPWTVEDPHQSRYTPKGLQPMNKPMPEQTDLKGTVAHE